MINRYNEKNLLIRLEAVKCAHEYVLKIHNEQQLNI